MSLPSIVSPEWLAKQCEELRLKVLVGTDGEDLIPTTLAPAQCEQFMLLAISALEQAQRYAMLAEYAVRRGE